MHLWNLANWTLNQLQIHGCFTDHYNNAKNKTPTNDNDFDYKNIKTPCQNWYKVDNLDDPEKSDHYLLDIKKIL